MALGKIQSNLDIQVIVTIIVILASCFQRKLNISAQNLTCKHNWDISLITQIKLACTYIVLPPLPLGKKQQWQL